VRRTAFAFLVAVMCVPLALLAGACGGAPLSDLLTGTDSGGGGSGEPDATSGDHDATGSVDASADREAPVDTGSGRDTEPAQVDSGADDVMASDTGAGDAAPDPGIACGSGTYCAPSSQTCCVSSGGLGGTQRRCANGNSCGSGTPVHCDDTADCPSGQVCCGTDYANVGYTDISCRMTCGPSTFTITYARFCDPNNNDCPSTAPNCKMSTIITGYTVCGM
jgi:hypothetical protein